MAYSVCLQCRNEFNSNNELHQHIRSDCWATKHEARIPREWTPSLKAYVREAVKSASRAAGFNSDVYDTIRQLKDMIEVNSTSGIPIINWQDRIALPEPRATTSETTGYAMEVDTNSTFHSKPKILAPRTVGYTGFAISVISKPIPSASASAPPPAQKYGLLFQATSYDSTPQSLFKHADNHLFVANHDPQEFMVYTDGACSNNGMHDARGGCAFVFRHQSTSPIDWPPPKGAFSMYGSFFFRLEDVGPTGRQEVPTSNRAELRAVVAALAYLHTGGFAGDTPPVPFIEWT